MPLFQADPLSDPTLGLDPTVNPFVSRIQEAARIKVPLVSYGPELGGLRGQWAEDMGARMRHVPRRLVLEIGCHKGGVIVPMAMANRDWAFVGCDITFKRVITTAERAHTAQLANIHAIYANAHLIDRVFAPQELDGVIIFFPDPWSKKERQVERRLINPTFIDRLLPTIKRGGFFWLKTDHPHYFESVATILADKLSPVSGPDAIGLENYPSAYERKFQALDTPTFSQVWVNHGSNH